MYALRENSLVRRMGQADLQLCMLFNRGVHRPAIQAFFAVISRLGDGVFWYALMAVLPVAFGRYGLVIALHMVLTALVCLGLYKYLKRTFVRPRPYTVSSYVRPGTRVLDVYSFPSGHTLHAVAFTLVAVAYLPQLAVALVPLTLLIAMSRMVLGLHYPSDVLAGAGIGALLAVISLDFRPLLESALGY